MGKKRLRGPKQWMQIMDQGILDGIKQRMGYVPVQGPFLFAKKRLRVLLTEDPGTGVHFSISHPSRYPTWEEQVDARYALCPKVPYMASILPPKDEYVNLDKNTFHWWAFDVNPNRNDEPPAPPDVAIKGQG